MGCSSSGRGSAEAGNDLRKPHLHHCLPRGPHNPWSIRNALLIRAWWTSHTERPIVVADVISEAPWRIRSDVKSRLASAPSPPLWRSRSAPALGAQQAQGTVRDSMSGVAVPGAVVSALDSTGAIAERVVSGGDGRFRITLPVGSATLRVIRIGFRPRDVRLPDAAAARDHPIDIRLSSLPALLSRVHVSDQAICPGADDRSGALALWEQARAGLLAAVVLRQTKPGQMDVLDYVTDEDPGSRLVLRQSIGRVNGSTGRPFVAVNEARGFAEHGYMTRDSSGLTFNAPDADVLLDQEFARTHCFRAVRDDAAHPAQVGLAFEPAPGGRPDGFVDVRGTLWLDSDHPALRTLDFAYTGLDRAYVDAGTGGALGFRNMPNGMVYIDRWNMLLPAMQATSASRASISAPALQKWQTSGLGLRHTHVSQYREVGGVVISARWSDGAHAETDWARSLERCTTRRDTRCPAPSSTWTRRPPERRRIRRDDSPSTRSCQGSTSWMRWIRPTLHSPSHRRSRS